MSNWHYSSIGSGSGLVQDGWQAITWNNADLVPQRIYAALGRGVLNKIEAMNPGA